MSSTRKKRSRRSSTPSVGALVFDDVSEGSTSTPSKKQKKRVSEEAEHLFDDASSQNSSQRETEEDDLYAIVSRKAALAPVIDDWVKSYKFKKTQATTKLVNFVLKSSAVDSHITESQFTSDDEPKAAKLVTKLTQKNVESYKDKSLDYPIASKKKESKKFRQSFSEFWKKLITTCSKEIIYDDFLIPHLSFWFTQFSRSTLRAFRHTATVANMEIAKAIIKVLKTLQTQLETNERQVKTEKKKNKNSTKHKDLVKKSTKITKNIRTLEKYMTNIFNGIFVHRYRDHLADIRIDCISYFGDWIVEYPSVFMDNNYLKYVGWLLSDDDARVRNHAVKVLLKLYSDDQLNPQMAKFSEYYKKRLAQMIMDVDFNCSAASMKLFTYLDKEEILDEDAIMNVYAHISHESPLLRSAAAQFIYDKVFTSQNPKEELLTLIQFIEERTPTPDIPNFCVDALWTHLNSLRNWEAMIELLGNDQDYLSTSQQQLMAKVMLCAVKKVYGVPILPTTHALKLDVSTVKKEEENRVEMISEYTTELTKALPNLLKAYKGDQFVLEELVCIPLYFDLVSYSTFSSNKKAFREFLRVLSENFLSSTSQDTLTGIASTYAHLLNEEHAFHREVDVSLKAMVGKVNTALNVDSFMEFIGNDEESEILFFFRRVKALICNWDVVELLDARILELSERLLDLCIEGELMSSELGTLTLYINYFNLLWRFPKEKSLEESTLDQDVEVFVNRLLQVLTSSHESVKDDAFLILCDLVILFYATFKDKHLPVDMAQDISHYYEERMTRETDEFDFDSMEYKHRITQAFCKLIVHNLLGEHSETFAPIVILHYNRHGKSIEELIKSFVKKLKGDLRVDFAIVLLDTLMMVYQAESSQGDHDTFPSLRSLAKKLAYTFGITKTSPNMRILKRLVEKSIDWVSRDVKQRAAFPIHALAPFVSKMTKEVSSSLIQYVDLKISDESDEEELLQSFKLVLSGKKEKKKAIKSTTHREESSDVEDIEEFSQETVEEPAARRRSSRR